MTSQRKTVRHAAIIMDGNGRWAKERGLKTIEGHKEGANAVQKAVEAAEKFGVEYLTLYAFSTENWKRPKEEVDGLMSLLGKFVDTKMNEIAKRGIRVRVSGRIEGLPFITRRKLNKLIKGTENNQKGQLILALNYGGRAEITDAAKKIASDVKSGKLSPNDIDETLFSQYLYLPDVPDPDLMIRTGGDFRVSNFLLWEICYSEIYISQKLWPDFDEAEFGRAVESFNGRERRFGLRKS
jgi:undecaprenyl diphosphate synthase